jgi:hypothetical protein
MVNIDKKIVKIGRNKKKTKGRSICFLKTRYFYPSFVCITVIKFVETISEWIICGPLYPISMKSEWIQTFALSLVFTKISSIYICV